MRARIVHLVEVEGRERKAVARSLMVAPSTVRYTLAHFHREGHLRDSHGGGHEATYDDEQMERLWDLILHNGRMVARALIREMGDSAPAISERTMQRYRRILHMSPRLGRITARGMILHHAERAAWASERRRAPVAWWLHSGESTLCMRDTGELVWAPIGSPVPQIEVDTLRCHVCMWGVVWDGGSVFAQYDGHLTAASYIDLLEEHLLPHQENLGHRAFLLDRHSAHTAKKTKRWLERHHLVHEVLPTHSPQFNAIEGCWAWIKQHARAAAPDSLASLQAACRAACAALPQSVINGHLRNAQTNIRTYAEADASLES